MVKNVYEKCMEDKKLAANVLLPLIEFEFSLLSDDAPILLQSKENKEQLEAIFKICKKHGWTDFSELKVKRKGYMYFRLTKQGLREIFELAGPFISKKRNEWTKLLLERSGKKGGYMRDKEKTKTKIFNLLKCERKKLTTEDICLKLRLTPSTVREGLRSLLKNGQILRERKGRKLFYYLS